MTSGLTFGSKYREVGSPGARCMMKKMSVRMPRTSGTAPISRRARKPSTRRSARQCECAGCLLLRRDPPFLDVLVCSERIDARVLYAVADTPYLVEIKEPRVRLFGDDA